MDSKDTWPVVKFLISATGLKRRDARRILDEISKEKYSQLFVQARAWDRDTSAQASKALADMIGSEQIGVLMDATIHARTPSGPHEDEEDEPKKRTRKRRKA